MGRIRRGDEVEEGRRMATICTATRPRLPQKGNDLRVRARRIWGEVPSTGSSGACRLVCPEPREGIG